MSDTFQPHTKQERSAMSELAEPIRRMSKRLLRLAKDSGGVISVQNLSAAQDITAKLHGASSTFDALAAKPDESKVDQIALALAIGELLGADDIDYAYRSGDDEKCEVVFYLWSDDLQSFDLRSQSVTGGLWDPASDSHKRAKYEIALSFLDCARLPPSRQVLAFAQKVIGYLQQFGGGYAFGYVATGDIRQLIS